MLYLESAWNGMFLKCLNPIRWQSKRIVRLGRVCNLWLVLCDPFTIYNDFCFGCRYSVSAHLSNKYRIHFKRHDFSVWSVYIDVGASAIYIIDCDEQHSLHCFTGIRHNFDFAVLFDDSFLTASPLHTIHFRVTDRLICLGVCFSCCTGRARAWSVAEFRIFGFCYGLCGNLRVCFSRAFMENDCLYRVYTKSRYSIRQVLRRCVQRRIGLRRAGNFNEVNQFVDAAANIVSKRAGSYNSRRAQRCRCKVCDPADGRELRDGPDSCCGGENTERLRREKPFKFGSYGWL